MPLNLITDPWIPALATDGTRRVIAPWQMADITLERVDWPRADLNIACLELLIGLAFMADPPEDDIDWIERQTPDPDRLRTRLLPFAPAFNLMGDGPRFMQDLEPLTEEPKSPDMLFIDSAGGQTARNNADLMVWRDRYPALSPELAAMALYTLQAHAPSGGAGNRTSMRGGGPMVTLVEPRSDTGALWPLTWANVPCGRPAPPDALPWMRKTRTSEKGQQVFPEHSHPVEAFFGMPRRLRLIETDGRITGVVQRPYGTNYAGWDHPLTPYYRLKPDSEWLPKHPRAGHFGYRNWLGVILAGQSAADAEVEGLTRRAQSLRDWFGRGDRKRAQVLVAGWAMDNMKPRDFTFSRQPCVALPREQMALLEGMIEAAENYGIALRAALKPVVAEGESREALREAFFAGTEADFIASLAALERGDAMEGVARDWLGSMRRVAMGLFERRALPGLADRRLGAQEDIILAHRSLRSAFAGYGKFGKTAWDAMMLPLPVKTKKEAA